MKMNSCGAGRLKVGDEVLTLLRLFDSGEDHFRSLNVFLWVLQVFEQCVLSPHNTTLLIGTTVRKPIGLSRLAPEKSVEVGSLLVGTTFLDGVALRAFGLEDLGSLLFVSWFGHF